MSYFVIGLACLTAAYVMLRIARPRPDGEAAAFLSRNAVAASYALIVTAMIGLGVAMTVSGAGSLVATATAALTE